MFPRPLPFQPGPPCISTKSCSLTSLDKAGKDQVFRVVDSNRILHPITGIESRESYICVRVGIAVENSTLHPWRVDICRRNSSIVLGTNWGPLHMVIVLDLQQQQPGSP